MKYPKINSLFKRDETTRKFIWDSYAAPEFGEINHWSVEEKIDGMNTRVTIHVAKTNMTLQGRSDYAMIPAPLIDHLNTVFTVDKRREIIQFMNSKDKFTLFGEGYGPKIQSGGNYRDDIGFILFDVWGGSRWSTREEVKDIAALLGLPTPHNYGMMTKEQIIELVRSKPNSPTAIRPMEFEGVVCRTEPLLINNYTGDPVMFKLKCKDML